MPPLSAEARNLNWLLSNFAKTTPGVAYALVVSADGLPITIPEGLDLAMADQLAAIASGLASLSQGAARHLDAGTSSRPWSRWSGGFLLVMTISDISCLTVLTASSCDVGVVGDEMALRVARAGDILTPRLRAELQAALPP